MQTPDAPTRTTRTGRSPRPAAGLAAGLVALGALSPVVAHADDFAYTGACSVTGTPTGSIDPVTRSFRARVPRVRDGARWNLGGYDYWYAISSPTAWGPHSDELLTMTRGRIDGPSPWHSPDDHTSNVAWVQERGWKGVSSAGASQLKFHAWFDIPRENDPECDVYTATF